MNTIYTILITYIIDVVIGKLQSIEENLAELTLSVKRTTSSIEKLERHLRGVGLRNGALEGPSAEVVLELETIFPLQTMAAFENFEASLKSNPQKAQDLVRCVCFINESDPSDLLTHGLLHCSIDLNV